MHASLLLGALALFTEVGAHRPMKPEAWWAGLDADDVSAEARGVHALRVPQRLWVRVPGGTFVMGSSPTEMVRATQACRREILRSRCEEPILQTSGIVGSFRSEVPAHDVTVSTFEIDRTEVPVAAYARCVASGVCASPSYTPGDPRFDRPELPVSHVRWEDAATYCQWARARLPTEAEWEYAARGNTGRDWPWGAFYNPHLANHGAYAPDETDGTDGYLGLAPVEAFSDGATPLGVLQMSGNVAEWVFDWWDIDENGFGGYETKPQTNPTGAKHGIGHVVRGGSYVQGQAWIRAAARGTPALLRSANVGFRCAKDPG
jgi:formylglycine-generating enzyme required for sulfatase activity